MIEPLMMTLVVMVVVVGLGGDGRCRVVDIYIYIYIYTHTGCCLGNLVLGNLHDIEACCYRRW